MLLLAFAGFYKHKVKNDKDAINSGALRIELS